MKKILFASFIFLLSLSVALAQSEIDVESKISAIKEFEGQELPGIVGKVFGNERINFEIDNLGTIGIITEDKTFKTIQLGALENPTIKAYSNEETLRNIESSSDPLKEFESALDSRDITYKGVGLNKIKISFVKTIHSISKWFR